MKSLNKNNSPCTNNLPIKVLQFGEGNFLRAFADWCIDVMNERIDFNAGVVVIQPIAQGMVRILADQDCLYHHLINGTSAGQAINEYRLISCIKKAIDPFEEPTSYLAQAHNEDLRIVISNTTEQGITFDSEDLPSEGHLAKTFPGKLTQLLNERFNYFNGKKEAGLVILPCELIDKNGDNLKSCILKYANTWSLGQGFIDWIHHANYFANTLVDRIVPGFPKEEINAIQQKLGYEDRLVVCSEVFHLWVIDGSPEIQSAFPANKAGLNVKFVSDITPYRLRKVRILNGAHTAMVPLGYLSGVDTVKGLVDDEILGNFISDTIMSEICPTINLPIEELETFQNDVIERFKNPFIRHELKSIALNSISKFKVRVVPTIKDYYSLKNELPMRLVLSFAALIKIYLSEAFCMQDEEEILEFFSELRQKDTNHTIIAQLVLSNKKLWKEDLSLLPNLAVAVAECLEALDGHSITALITNRFEIAIK